MNRKFWRYLGPLTGLLLFVAAVWVLHRELRNYTYHDLVKQLQAVGWHKLTLAGLFTVLSYGVLTWYDSLAFRYLKNPMPYRKIAFGSFLGYVFSHNIGLSVIGAGAARLRVYSAWGISPLDIGKIVVFCSLTFWLGFGLMGSIVFLVRPLEVPVPLQPYLPFTHAWPLGLVLAGLTATYLLVVLTRTKPFSIRGWQMAVPARRMTLVQLGLSMLDWLLFGNVLYILLPEGHNLPFGQFMCVFLLAEAAALASHVPGGIGVLDAVVLVLLPPTISKEAVLASLLAYRGIYYFIPLIVGTAMLAAHEVLQRKEYIKREGVAGQWGPLAIPNLLTIAVFIAGALMVVSAAIPDSRESLRWLRGQFGYLDQVAHFLSSLVGMGLMVMARGLQRRLSRAYYVVLALLALEILFSLAKGLGYFEAGLLGVVLIALLPARAMFYRKASLGSQWMPPAWIVSILIVLVASIGVGMFTFRLKPDNWNEWIARIFQLDFHGRQSSRFLRTMAGTVALAFFIALARLMRPARHAHKLPQKEDLSKAERVIDRCGQSEACMALHADKELLFSASGDTFLQFAKRQQSWVSMGEPVGRSDEKRELSWQFRELSESHGGLTVFYGVDQDNQSLYLELGLSLFKVGQEAILPLDRFALEDPARRELRGIQEDFRGRGFALDIVQPHASPELMAQLRQLCRQWQDPSLESSEESGGEVAHFDESYLGRFPLALIYQNGAIAAFANLWLTRNKEEAAIDMIYCPRRHPQGLIDYLFVEVAQWAAEQRYQRFNLGMAPMSQQEKDHLEPLWAQLSDSVFRHGEHFYDFQSLRRHKEKFAPQWKDKYVACPSGQALSPVLNDVAAIISATLRSTRS